MTIDPDTSNIGEHDIIATLTDDTWTYSIYMSILIIEDSDEERKGGGLGQANPNSGSSEAVCEGHSYTL